MFASVIMNVTVYCRKHMHVEIHVEEQRWNIFILMLNNVSGFTRKGKYEQIRTLMKDEKNKNIDVNAPAKCSAVSIMTLTIIAPYQLKIECT